MAIYYYPLNYWFISKMFYIPMSDFDQFMTVFFLWLGLKSLTFVRNVVVLLYVITDYT